MDENASRLADCFLAVFPDISADEIAHASSASVQSWDSVATVTLLAIVEEEFGIEIEVKELARFVSFGGILSFLGEIERQRAQSSYDEGVAR
jgi:acyl carrier protein